MTVSGRATREQRRAYAAALAEHGARVVEIEAGGLEIEFEDLNGLLLCGGGDVDPTRFGEPRHPKTENVDPARDEFELGRTRAAVKAGVPVFGICRGAQVLGVALGGKLTQDISDLVRKAYKHSDAQHQVTVAPDSLLAQVLGCERLEVNSFHHQANSALGRGVRAAAWSDDSVIEAIEMTGHGFVLGVQWHPERMGDARQKKLFAAFVEAAAGRASGKR
jgi:putative glutamine amidotransferase